MRKFLGNVILNTISATVIGASLGLSAVVVMAGPRQRESARVEENAIRERREAARKTSVSKAMASHSRKKAKRSEH